MRSIIVFLETNNTKLLQKQIILAKKEQEKQKKAKK